MPLGHSPQFLSSLLSATSPLQTGFSSESPKMLPDPGTGSGVLRPLTSPQGCSHISEDGQHIIALSCINCQGGLRSKDLCPLTSKIMIWFSTGFFFSKGGLFNHTTEQGPDLQSRGRPLATDWRLNLWFARVGLNTLSPSGSVHLQEERPPSPMVLNKPR